MHSSMQSDVLSLKTEFLKKYGWSDFFSTDIADGFKDLFPCRVIGEERSFYRLQTDLLHSQGASVSGKFQFQAGHRADFPAVGDWVLAELPVAADRAIIHRLLPRRSVIQRKQVGAGSEPQILAANVDYIFITTAMSQELNFRRIERYLAISWESGAVPVILLTKADVCEDPSLILEDVRHHFPGVDVHSLTKDDFSQATFLASYLKIGKTAVVVGSSGVGKSTLVNYLVGREDIKTQAVREDDGKGRHTTTSRCLYETQWGGLIIDTPGMRELQLLNHEEGVKAQFHDIEELATLCRFKDCQHKTEPGCQIQAALSSSNLSQERWASYLKLAAEVRHALRKQDKSAAAEDKKRWKKISELGRIQARNKQGLD